MIILPGSTLAVGVEGQGCCYSVRFTRHVLYTVHRDRVSMGCHVTYCTGSALQAAASPGMAWGCMCWLHGSPQIMCTVCCCTVLSSWPRSWPHGGAPILVGTISCDVGWRVGGFVGGVVCLDKVGRWVGLWVVWRVGR
jgi:hypothetical protein